MEATTKVGHTPGPWVWRQTPHGIGLYAPHSGQLVVMDFVRRGMNGAQPRFSDRKGDRRGGLMHKAETLDLAAHPDARLIAAAPALLAACRAADQFIRNGIEFGYIRMPDPDTPDAAHETPEIIRAAIAAATTGE